MRLGEISPTAWELHIDFLFEQIYDWLDCKASEGFDQSFIDSLKEQWDDRRRLSEKQEAALQNIYDKWIDN